MLCCAILCCCVGGVVSSQLSSSLSQQSQQLADAQQVHTLASQASCIDALEQVQTGYALALADMATCLFSVVVVINCQRLSQLEASLSSCQSELSARDSKLSKLRSLLSRLTKQSDEQKSRLAEHSSERDGLLRCIANYRRFMSLPWSTVVAAAAAGTNSTATTAMSAAASSFSSSFSSSAASSTQPNPPSSASPSSSSAVSSSLSLMAASSLSDEAGGVDSAVSAVASSVDSAPLSSFPSPLDEAVDVDQCQPILRVTLSDCTHWLLLSTLRDKRPLTAHNSPAATAATTERAVGRARGRGRGCSAGRDRTAPPSSGACHRLASLDVSTGVACCS